MYARRGGSSLRLLDYDDDDTYDNKNHFFYMRKKGFRCYCVDCTHIYILRKGRLEKRMYCVQYSVL